HSYVLVASLLCHRCSPESTSYGSYLVLGIVNLRSWSRELGLPESGFCPMAFEHSSSGRDETQARLALGVRSSTIEPDQLLDEQKLTGHRPRGWGTSSGHRRRSCS